MNKVHGRQELPRNSRVGMSPIGSYVGGLTSKGQVGVLLGEHRGWILRMATLIKADRLQNAGYQTQKPFRFSSDFRPEAYRLSFRLKELRTFACFPTKRQVRDTRYKIREGCGRFL